MILIFIVREGRGAIFLVYYFKIFFQKVIMLGKKNEKSIYVRKPKSNLKNVNRCYLG